MIDDPEHILDHVETVREVDRSDMLATLLGFGQQCGEASRLMPDTPLPVLGKGLKNIIVSGLGGSAIVGDLLASYVKEKIDVPVIVNRDYSLPGFAAASTLLFVISYSGNTEETLSVFSEALEKGVPMVCITSGGHLHRQALDAKQCLVTIPGGYPPRTALGYLFFPMLTVLTEAGLLPGPAEEIGETLDSLQSMAASYHIDKPLSENRAKQIAVQLHDRVPLLYTSERFYPVAKRWQTQLQENPERFAHVNVFPELNHNEIMSWASLARYSELFVPVLLKDVGDGPHIVSRMDISKELMEGTGLSVIQVSSEGESVLTRLFSLVYTGDFMSYYVALLSGTDPTPVARIEELKKMMKTRNT